MRYYFQRPPGILSKVLKLEEDEAEQSITIKIYKKEYDSEGVTEVLTGSKKISIRNIFLPNYYTLVPLKNDRLTAPLDMSRYLKKRQTIAVLENANRFGGYACALIFGSEPRVECTSIVGFYDFDFPADQIGNAEKYMTFHDMVKMAVDDTQKVRLEEDILKLDLAPQAILAGIESQVDMLSHITLALIEKLAKVSPVAMAELCREMPIKKFGDILDAAGLATATSYTKCLTDMEKQKKKLRNELKLIKKMMARRQ